jgi:methyl-accepting chemotaxis protein
MDLNFHKEKNHMPDKTKQTESTRSERDAIYDALNRIQSIIEFNVDGTVVTANENFCKTMGYDLEEIVGKHHRIFCDKDYVASADYADFWKKLAAGENIESEFKRLAKDGSEIWLQASYNPVLDDGGKPMGIVKFATDVTERKQCNAEIQGMMQAIDRSQAVIEFDLKGQVLNANENFLSIFGYSLEEVVGKHHRIFCEGRYAESDAYREFWQKLGNGEYESGEFKRLSKDGSEIWLQASYNPIFNAAGQPIKVVKFASDITSEIQRRSLALLEMATPVTKIWDGVLFAPIVGIIDSKRAVDIMEKTLSSIAENRAGTLVIDISGVAVVDTAVANHLIKITKAAVLMGCQSVISGISPAIAQTITELGVELGSVRTTSTIESALQDIIMQNSARS